VAVALLALGGCTATVRVLTRPEGAELRLPDGRVVTAPIEVPYRRRPGVPFPITVTAAGHRPVTLDLLRTEGRLLRWIGGAAWPRSGREITVVLVPDEPTPSGAH
jgi:hypothetical protein